MSVQFWSSTVIPSPMKPRWCRRRVKSFYRQHHLFYQRSRDQRWQRVHLSVHSGTSLINEAAISAGASSNLVFYGSLINEATISAGASSNLFFYDFESSFTNEAGATISGGAQSEISIKFLRRAVC